MCRQQFCRFIRFESRESRFGKIDGEIRFLVTNGPFQKNGGIVEAPGLHCFLSVVVALESLRSLSFALTSYPILALAIF